MIIEGILHAERYAGMLTRLSDDHRGITDFRSPRSSAPSRTFARLPAGAYQEVTFLGRPLAGFETIGYPPFVTVWKGRFNHG